MSTSYACIDPRDNLVVAIQDLSQGDKIQASDFSFELLTDVKSKHKFALKTLEKGDPAIMYGVLVGRASRIIQQGEVITVDNLIHASADYVFNKEKRGWTAPDVSRWKNKTFQGYHRKDGKVGTANYWIIFALTFCENRNLDVLKSALTEPLGYQSEQDFSVDTQILIDTIKDGGDEQALFNASIIKTQEEIVKNRVFPNVDGVKILKHEGGCGGTRNDAALLCDLLAGYLTNPNVAGATVLSLGCQNAQIKLLKDAIHKKDTGFDKPLFILEQQASKSERSFIEEAVKKTFAGLQKANELQRKPAPISELVLGLECGGSDGFSGISANPALGYTSDLLVALGGTAILAEFPELNGVEQELIDRCQLQEDAKKFTELMRAYHDQAIAVGSGFDSNPSPGNIKDGLITDAMKSAGAAKKGGTSPITKVLDYTEPVQGKGLHLLCTPGNDVESTTGLAGSGANMIVFTTGLGTPTGNPIVPVIKMSSNTHLFEKMNDVIDVNAGTIISGEDTIASKGEELLDYIISVASGEKQPHAVRLGHDDFIPWKRDISL